MTSAVLHGHVFWLDSHLEGCLRRPQGHHIQFTWKTTEKQKNNIHAHFQICSLSLTFSHRHTRTRPSVKSVLSSVVERCFTATLFPLSTHTHTGLIGGCWVGRVRRPVEVRREFYVDRWVKENSCTHVVWSTCFTRSLLLPVGHRGNLLPDSSHSCHLCILFMLLCTVSILKCLPTQTCRAFCFKRPPRNRDTVYLIAG